MLAATKALKHSNLCLLGVTVLTSMDDSDLLAAGYAESVESFSKNALYGSKKYWNGWDSLFTLMKSVR